jgi:GxxExxY protein
MEAVFEVHNAFGPGFVDGVYEEALAHELGLRGIPFERQKAVTITYKGQAVGTQRLDMVIEGKIVLELATLQFGQKQGMNKIERCCELVKRRSTIL